MESEVEVEDLWENLDLGGLLRENPIPLRERDGQGEIRGKDDIFVRHKKKWKKPSYNVLTERYSSKPSDPKKIPKSTLDRLADPLRGCYASICYFLSCNQSIY